MLDDVNDIDDWSQITIWALIDRIERSSGFEHSVYRETELDELWRIIDIAARKAEPGSNPTLVELEAMRAVVMQAHDLIGVDGDLPGAAVVLKTHFG